MKNETARALLTEEKERLQTAAGETNDGPNGQETEESAILLSLRARREEVEAALKRLDDGNYGSCEECGKPIGDDRLEAFPTARFCIEHQAAIENGAA